MGFVSPWSSSCYPGKGLRGSRFILWYSKALCRILAEPLGRYRLTKREYIFALNIMGTIDIKLQSFHSMFHAPIHAFLTFFYLLLLARRPDTLTVEDLRELRYMESVIKVTFLVHTSTGEI